ncbi:MAG: vWA domain-containing protein [Planctomycetota bacterium]
MNVRKWLARTRNQQETDGGEVLGDLALSALGVLMIAFTGYVLKFQAEQEAPDPAPVTIADVNFWRGKHQRAQEVIDTLKRELQAGRERFEAASKVIRDQENSLGNPQLFGLNGPMTGIVFCLDLSGSMVNEDGARDTQPKPELVRRFAVVKQRLKQMVRSLKFERFTVIGFGGDPRDLTTPRLVASTNALVQATPEAREAACRQIDSWKAIGGTPTLPALRAAIDLPGVEHVVLLTDGMPTLGGTQDDVLDHLRRRGRGVVVDVVGIGDQSMDRSNDDSMELLEFTRRVAQLTGGFFQAW